jgi:hypothetical protein
VNATAAGTQGNTVYRVDLDAGKMLPVCGLSGRAMFIGIEMALPVSPSVFPSISADKIYLGWTTAQFISWTWMGQPNLLAST